MLLGTQYFRPPNPEVELWEEDFRQIKTLGFNLVRCWLYWRVVEPREGQWDWSAYDRFMELAETHGLRAVIQLIPECQPQWFLDQHRDVWPRDEHGRELGQAGYSMVVLGGYPGIFYDQPAASAGIARFYTAVATRYATSPALHTWDVWNEIQPHGGLLSYDSATTRKWQAYLAERFGDIDHLNRCMLSQYATFDAIALVRPSSMYDGPQQWQRVFNEFRHHRLAAELARRASLIRSIDSVHPVVSHSAGIGLNETNHNVHQLAATVDGFGISQYINERTTGGGDDYRYAAFMCAAARGATAGKPWWLSEQAGGPIYYQYGHTNKTAAAIRSHLLLALAHGAAATLYWQYRNERVGEEAPSWGLINLDGSLNERTGAVAQVAQALHREARGLAESSRPPSAVGILHDMTTVLYERSTQAWVKQGVCAAAEAENTYLALADIGLSPDIIYAEQVSETGMPDTCRLLILPMRTALTDKVADRVLAWVHAGGTVVSTAYLGMYDEDGFMPRLVPRSPWRDAFGIHVATRHYPDTAALETTLPDLPPLAGHWTVEELRLHGADVVATWNDLPAITHARQGAGHLWYVATCPAQAADRSSWQAWLKYWAAGVAAWPWYTAEPCVLGERRIGTDCHYLYLTNVSSTPQAVTIHGSIDLCGDVRDVLTAEVHGALTTDSTLKLTIPPRDSVWLTLRT